MIEQIEVVAFQEVYLGIIVHDSIGPPLKVDE